MKTSISRIESKDNNKLKLIRKLRQRKNRYKEKKFVIESRKLLEEAIKSSLKLDFIVLRDDLDPEKIKEFMGKGFNIFLVNSDTFASISQMSNPDGHLAVANFIEDKPFSSDKILLLDNLNDPGNLGTIIRSAEAFGFMDVYLYRAVDRYNEKVLRASMGSSFRVNIKDIGIKEVRELAESYEFFLADMGGRDYRSLSFPKRVCLVIGNESNGISEELRYISTELVSIPMRGDIESLNAAISASILMAGI